jgi:putative transposase
VIVASILEAQRAGARLKRACAELGLDERTVQRWRLQGEQGEDRRRGPKSEPRNKLSTSERRKVLELANSAEYRNLSPKQIVPKLADSGCYVASESTFYRVLRDEGLLAHRGRAKAATSKPPAEHVATRPLEVWSWDITYLRAEVVGKFYYLYLHEDVWSRKIVGSSVHETECTELAADALGAALRAEDIDGHGLVLHQDNGSPMKGATLKATMERLGVIASYSRPRVSDDNPYSESLFRTLKYRPDYPRRPFASLEEARRWVAGFVAWYNHQHLHSGIGFVTPEERHSGRAKAILTARREVYARARRRNPERWSGAVRAWNHPVVVRLNPSKTNNVVSNPQAAAA